MTAFVPADAAVWFEIPVSDFDRARAFYANILQSEIKVDADGPNPMASLSPRTSPPSPAIFIPARPLPAAPAAPSISRLPRR